MPIYAYRCESCGHAKDVLQKMSDPVHTTCPACGAETYRKQVTAAGFQLKGSGWYATDFRGGATAAAGGGAADTGKAESSSGASSTDTATPKASETKDAKGNGGTTGGSGHSCTTGCTAH